jgi:hypothetical protein
MQQMHQCKEHIVYQRMVKAASMITDNIVTFSDICVFLIAILT